MFSDIYDDFTDCKMCGFTEKQNFEHLEDNFLSL